MILVNKLAILLFVAVFANGLAFLYMNPIPAEIGMVCDNLAISPSRHPFLTL